MIELLLLLFAPNGVDVTDVIPEGGRTAEFKSVPPVVRNNPVLGDTNPAPNPVPVPIGEAFVPKPVPPDGEFPRNEGVKDGEEIPLLENGVNGDGEIVPAIFPGVDGF